LVVQQADQLLAIHMRSKGNIESLLTQRLASRVPGRVFLALGAQELVSPSVAEPLMAAGAIGWYVPASEADTSVSAFSITPRPTTAPIMELSQLQDQERYLAHCTRNATGPWPDQSEPEFLDELIMGDIVRDRSAFATLRRITAQRRILATSDAIRNGIDVVSLTAVPLGKLNQLRRYRSHRGRWDFEPYGVAIRRDYLISWGAKQVTYGDEATWQSLSAEARPYFQKVGNQKNSIDWRVEQEWRLLGDLDLSAVSADQALLFVPTREEAGHLANISNWPIVVLDTA
jgi:hypothetical protein